jgi:hypothetical protein
MCLLIEDMNEQSEMVQERLPRPSHPSKLKQSRPSRRSKCKQSRPVYPVVAMTDKESPVLAALTVFYRWFTGAQQLSSVLCSCETNAEWFKLYKEVCKWGCISARLTWLMHRVMTKADMPCNVETCIPGKRCGCWFPKYDLWLSACDTLPLRKGWEKAAQKGERLSTPKTFVKGVLVHASSVETSGRTSDIMYQATRARDRPTAQLIAFSSQFGGLGLFAVGRICERSWATEYAGRVLTHSEALAMRAQGTDTHIRTLVSQLTHLDGRLQPEFGLDMAYYTSNSQVTVL